MKTTALKLILLTVITIELGGCLSLGTMPQQFTSMNTGCRTADIQISNERVELNGEESWTAKCGGKIYDCVYFPEASSNCYLRAE